MYISPMLRKEKTVLSSKDLKVIGTLGSKQLLPPNQNLKSPDIKVKGRSSS